MVALKRFCGNVSIIAFLLIGTFLKAQSISLYRLKNSNIAAYYQNGTYTPNSQFHISLPQIEGAVENPISIGDISESLVQKTDYNALDIPILVSKFDENFELFSSIKSHLLGGGFAIDSESYLSFRLSAVADMYVEVDKGLLDILSYGFGSSNQVSSDKNSYAQALGYMEFVTNYTHKIPQKKLVISGGIKYLSGMYYLDGRIPTFLAKNNNATSFSLELDNLSILHTESPGGVQGAGMGFDFAISWETSKVQLIGLPIDLSLAIEDIFSFISWSGSVKRIQSIESASTIDRALITDVVNNFKFDEITANFKKIGEQIKTERTTENLSTTTLLAPKIFFSADVKLFKSHEVGIIYFANTGRGNAPMRQKIGLGYIFTTPKRLFAASITPTFNLSKNTSYYSTAVGLNLNAGFFQMHLFSDALEQLIVQNLLQAVNFGIGFSLNFGSLSSKSNNKSKKYSL